MYRTLENPKAPFPAYTTGEVAKICGISQGTIIRAFDRGTIGGFRVPGSRFRRITRRDLLNYMRTHGLEAHPEDHTVAVFAAVNDEIDEIVEIVRLIQALLERSNEHVTVHIADTMFDLGLALSGKNAELLVVSKAAAINAGKEVEKILNALNAPSNNRSCSVQNIHVAEQPQSVVAVLHTYLQKQGFILKEVKDSSFFAAGE